MQTDNSLNTLPIQQFISNVRGADAGKQREYKMSIDQAKRLAFTLGEVMARLNGDLEQLLLKKKEQDEVINISLDGGGGWK